MLLFSKKSCLGVDLGTAAVKIVELSRERRGLVLKNYGLTEPRDVQNFRTTDLSDKDLGSLIKEVTVRMKAGTSRAVLSLPVASSFSTLMDLPIMSQEELTAAIPYEAKKFIPIPLEEVELDWSVVRRSDKELENQMPAKVEKIEAVNVERVQGLDKEMEQAVNGLVEAELNSADIGNSLAEAGQELDEKIETASVNEQKPILDEIKRSKSATSATQKSKIDQSSGMLVILVAVPKEVIKKYAEVARIAGLRLLALEQEAFSLARSLVDSAAGISLIADIGNKSTDLVVVEDGFVSVTHNLETTSRDLVVVEIERIVRLYKEKYNKNIRQCILAGGKILAGRADSFSDSLTRDWSDILRKRFGMEVKIGNPVQNILYHPALRNKMIELGPALAVALGLAMREL